MNLKQIQEYVVRPALKYINAHSEAAEQLLMGTITQESGGDFIKQIGGGPAMGIVQMEPATHGDLWENFIRFRPGLRDKLQSLASYRNPGAAVPMADELVFNLWYAVAMARVHYLRQKEPLPKAGDVVGMANYWKRYYNTEHGKGKPSEFLEQFPYQLFQLPRVESSACESNKESS
ncbi:hypothetical protein [Vibrio furnissii]|uniref:hypothetical protein n=1 Tax=Vibrio furnissii TaxID=29494 RepID=UPI001EEC412B|nr:hypothetical protein [Vibrio furnissii]MCG6216260.1 hypothetical protein [Vibrio furnissii]